jgi:AcrR family transcriptional regulator
MKTSAKNARISLQIRRPTQERGRQKFESILDSADRLLVDRDPADISIYDLAAELNTSPPSIYHFFPDISLVFVGLAERYLDEIKHMPLEVDKPVANWQELNDIQFERVRVIYETRAPVRKILLGPGYSYEILNRDLATSVVNAARLLELMGRHFDMPNIPNLLDRLVEMIKISDAMWMVSIYRHGRITDEGAELARRARTGYLRTVLPEYLPPRPQNKQIRAVDTRRRTRAKASKGRR